MRLVDYRQTDKLDFSVTLMRSVLALAEHHLILTLRACMHVSYSIYMICISQYHKLV